MDETLRAACERLLDVVNLGAPSRRELDAAFLAVGGEIGGVNRGAEVCYRHPVMGTKPSDACKANRADAPSGLRNYARRVARALLRAPAEPVEAPAAPTPPLDPPRPGSDRYRAPAPRRIELPVPPVQQGDEEEARRLHDQLERARAVRARERILRSEARSIVRGVHRLMDDLDEEERSKGVEECIITVVIRRRTLDDSSRVEVGLGLKVQGNGQVSMDEAPNFKRFPNPKVAAFYVDRVVRRTVNLCRKGQMGLVVEILSKGSICCEYGQKILHHSITLAGLPNHQMKEM